MTPPDHLKELPVVKSHNNDQDPHLEKIEGKAGDTQSCSHSQDISTSYLLMNLHDKDTAQIREQTNNSIIDGWSVGQSTHRETENKSIKESIAALNKRYSDQKKPEIKGIKDYIHQNQNTLSQQGLTVKDIGFLEVYLDRLTDKLQHIELLQLCWLALDDKSMICKECDLGNMPSVDEMVSIRKYLFLKNISKRLQGGGVCVHGSYNAIYEAMQCLHPDAKRIIDLAAIPDLIMLIVQKTLLEYLKESAELTDQLKTIKQWLINTSEGNSIFSGIQSNVEQELINKICLKFKEKGYGELSADALQNIKKQFYATPLFLREFENLQSEFETKGQDIYQPIPKIMTLEEHVKYFKRKNLTRKLNWLCSFLADSFDQLIEKLIHEKIVWDKESINMAVFMFITDHLKKDAKKLEEFMRLTRNNSKASTEVRLYATFYLVIKMIENKQSTEEIFKELAHIGNAEEVMWLLCYFYSRTYNISQRESLQQLILLLYKQGIKTEKCVHSNISAAQLLISSKLKPDDFILHILPNKIYKSYDDTSAMGDGAILSMSSGISLIIIGVTVAFTIVSGFILQIILISLGTVLPLMFRNEILGLFKSPRIRSKVTAKIENTLFDLPIVQKNQFKDFFITPNINSHLAKLRSPLTKIAKLFNETALPYAKKVYDKLHFINDFAQPLDGVKHIFKGLFKIITSLRFIFKAQGSLADITTQAVSGVAKILCGISEIVLTPYTYCIKMPCRAYQTLNKKSALQGEMMFMATQLQDELFMKFSSRLSSKASLLSAENNSTQKMRDNLFNQASALHQRYKNFKKSMPVVGSQFKKNEKDEWHNVKTAFFTRFIDKQCEVSAEDLKALNNYCSLYTHR